METTKIMVVDDEKQICLNVEKILKKNNFEVAHAGSAEEAMEMMAKESFSLLISDIVMPGVNGLELLKMVKNNWPLTKAVMMTAYASTDTAMKAIRMGALDYIPKPFTPDELRNTVGKALSGELREVTIPEEEKEMIDLIDIDVPFDAKEVSDAVGEDYAKMLGRSDMPVVEVPKAEELEFYCKVGDMVCDIFKKLGATCKAGIKTTLCSQKTKKKKGKKEGKKGFDPAKQVDVDQPFNYKQMVAAVGEEYVHNLRYDGVSFPYYEELKKNVETMLSKGRIDVDMPFDRDEVAKYTSKDYPDTLTRSDTQVVEVPKEAQSVNFCATGDMVCDIFKKLGATCKAGVKTSLCPQKSKGKKGKKGKAVDVKKLIGIDQPFDYEEVVAVTGPEYVHRLEREGFAFMPYEELKKNMQAELKKAGPAVISDGLREKLQQKSVLVIDDEVSVNNNVRKILSKKGFDVDQAVTKEEALEKIDRNSYKLVLLDLRIPGVKGLELLAAIREKRPESKVVIITGYASIETAVETARMGAVDYVAKPFTPDELRSATEKAFKLAA